MHAMLRLMLLRLLLSLLHGRPELVAAVGLARNVILHS